MILKIFSLTSRRTLKRNPNLPRLHPLPRGADERRDQLAEAGHEAGDEADPVIDIGVAAGLRAEAETTGDPDPGIEEDPDPGVEIDITGEEREVLRDTARVTMTTTMMITTVDNGELRTGDLADTDR